MGVARHEHVLELLALLQQLVEKHLYAFGHLSQLVTREEFQVDQHLVIARASGVDFLTHVAQSSRQHELHL